jgi:hypothetical protein
MIGRGMIRIKACCCMLVETIKCQVRGEPMKRTKFVVSVAVALLLCLVFFSGASYSSKLAAPLPALKGAVQIELGGQKAVIIAEDPLMIMTVNDSSLERRMGELGLKFSEQLGSGYFFERNLEKKLFKSDGFLGRYIIFKEAGQ